MRILRQATIPFGMIDVVQNINDMRATDTGRIVNAGALIRCVLVKLLDPPLGQVLHVVLAAEVEATGRTGFDAGGLQAGAHPVRAQRALMNSLPLWIERRER